MGKWVDTHCHLQLDKRDPKTLLERATEVEWVVVPGVDLTSSQAARRLAFEHHPRVLHTVGLHPHDASRYATEWEQLYQLMPEADAVGETGLDYYRNLSPRTDQQTNFIAHLRAAQELEKPIVVHCRDAFSMVHQILEKEGSGPWVVLHCWTGGPKWTRRFSQLGVTFSFAGPVAFPTGDTVRRGAALVAPDRVLVETDTPYLAPPPFQGQENEPANVGLVGEELAKLWSMDVDEVARLTSRRARQVFGKGEHPKGT